MGCWTLYEHNSCSFANLAEEERGYPALTLGYKQIFKMADNPGVVNIFEISFKLTQSKLQDLFFNILKIHSILLKLAVFDIICPRLGKPLAFHLRRSYPSKTVHIVRA